ncbi:MAG: hydrogen peroxide-inducible genes activator [Pseudomonadota bacterium]
MSRMPAVTLKQLSCLVAVEETLHFRRAAERCGMSQPALSAQIQNLEDALTVQLLERGRSGVTLTPIGREVVSRARDVVENAQGIVDVAASARGGLIGTIKLGTSATLGPYLLPQVVSTLHTQYKGLSLYIWESAPRDLEYDLGRGAHDVILAQLPTSSTDFVVDRLFREPLYLAIANDHPLASKEEVVTDDLKGLDVLCLSPQYHLHQQVSDLCQTFGARLQRDYEGTSLDAVRQMVGMGMGGAFLPALYCHSEISDRGSEISVRKIRGRAIMRAVGLVWRKSAGRSENYRSIAQIIREVARTRFNDLQVEAEAA